MLRIKRKISVRFSLGRAIGGEVIGGALLDAPILYWPLEGEMEADFNEADVWAAVDVDANNYDEIELELDDNSLFTTPNTETNTLDAAEVLAGQALFVPALGEGTWYGRVRLRHYVASVPQLSEWSNTVSRVIANDNWLTPNETDRWLMPNGVDLWLTPA